MTQDRKSATVQHILKKAPLSVDGLADAAGLSRQDLHAWATGRSIPTSEELTALADALDWYVGEFQVLADELRREVGE